MTGLRTNEELLKALMKSSSQKPSLDQLNEQRLSFVMGSLDDDNDMTRDEVQSVIERREGRKLATG